MQHPPHAVGVFLGVAPVADGVKIAHPKFALLALEDIRHGQGDLARNECLTTTGRLVVEQLTVDREHVVGLAVVARDPVAVDLCNSVRAARIERGVLILRGRARAEHLTGARLIETNARVDTANCLEHVDGAHTGGLCGIDRLIETHAHMRLRSEVVYLVRADVVDQLRHPRCVGDVAVMQVQVLARDVLVMVDMVDARTVESR